MHRDYKPNALCGQFKFHCYSLVVGLCLSALSYCVTHILLFHYRTNLVPQDLVFLGVLF